jgi:hypothetical protein
VSSDEKKIEIGYADGRSREVIGQDLDVETSQHIFGRDGYVRQLTVYTRAAL